MPTNRPFFANFLAAFRAHSAIAKASTTTSVSTSTTTSTSSSSQFSSLATNPASSARAIPNKNPAPAGATTAAVQAASHLSHTRHSTSPPARSPPKNFQRPPQRRGSDSSSDGGFRDALGGEKWYIGGRTATGEERFYRLGMVKRERSGDRLSMDRLSL